MSLTPARSMPFDKNPLIEASLPCPTPLTTASMLLIPILLAFSPTSSPTLAAAKGVPFLAPLKPREPLDDHARALPLVSVRRTFVLLYVD